MLSHPGLPDGPQLDLIRRYAKMLREEQAAYRTPHVARKRRLRREAAQQAARGALSSARGTDTPRPAA